ncbi:MAG: DUF1987 domain-containing protein [Flavobacteriales bacterium]|nr:DUF1987 domain-containing protein [Flavobacteriales bacterium]
MQDIEITGTNKTPSVRFIAARGLLELKGRSIPENSIDFYKSLLNWTEEYAANPQPETVVHVQLEYFNTSSSKCLLDLFKRLEGVNGRVEVHWYYEQDDEDMLEAGEDYEAIIGIPFRMIEIEAP